MNLSLSLVPRALGCCLRGAVIGELAEMQWADASTRPTLARVSSVVGLGSLTPAVFACDVCQH
ncbi:MAG: hypothetical protein ACI9BK_003177, partial [Acidimicrobiales bacterium]